MKGNARLIPNAVINGQMGSIIGPKLQPVESIDAVKEVIADGSYFRGDAKIGLHIKEFSGSSMSVNVLHRDEAYISSGSIASLLLNMIRKCFLK